MAFINSLPVVLAVVLGVIWIISLAKWDGKCHCDKSCCTNCPYKGVCEYETEEKDDE